MDDPNATDPSEARVFSTVISGLQKNYPREKMEEISTSFCFICLLHLANEQGLKLECAPDGKLPNAVEEAVDDEEVSVKDKKVGNLWDLKVCIFFLDLFRRHFSNYFSYFAMIGLQGSACYPCCMIDRNGTWGVIYIISFS
jgi:hypothetical protein